MSWFYDRIRSDGGLLVFQGAYDALSARLLAQSGVEAVYCGGFAATAAQFGLPDLGLLGLSDMAGIYGRVHGACQGKPLIVDADAGHGGLLNMERTVASFAAAGVSAFHVEDQVIPKRCGHLAGKDVVPKDDAIARVRTAVECSARNGMSVIARTDAIAVHGFEEAISRANAFLNAGAAAAFIDAPTTLDQIKSIPQQVQGPVVFNAAPTGIVKPPSDAALADMGYAVVLHPLVTLLAAASAIAATFPNSNQSTGRKPKLSFADLNEILETDQFLQREQQWSQGANND